MGAERVRGGQRRRAGSWNPANAVPLTTGPGTYPRWNGDGTLPPNTDMEYKFVIKQDGQPVIWETGANRTSAPATARDHRRRHVPQLTSGSAHHPKRTCVAAGVVTTRVRSRVTGAPRWSNSRTPAPSSTWDQVHLDLVEQAGGERLLRHGPVFTFVTAGSSGVIEQATNSLLRRRGGPGGSLP